ncbi:MAG TPA: hypothetical protein VND99_04545 [Candidatus Acidoferrales bacterium]|nr:hypothetical protein [Candidatus Acidoferrales bacterium]
MAKRKHSKKQIIQLITQYGIHIWAILIIANAALVYAYQFATHAASKSDTTVHSLDISQAPSPSPSGQISPSSPSVSQTSPSTGPLGPTINLTFTVPGIGSGGGVLKPNHLKRNVTVYLFAPDVNSLNPSVKPLYTIQSYATFDSDPSSPTYTSFLSPVIDLGGDVKDGNYQIAFRTDLSLRTLIKQSPTDLGGEIVSLAKDNNTFPIPSQAMLMGDVIPDKGDNNIDVNDYNAFINCYGTKNISTFCKGHNYGDFNDDGIIDGIDYNILLRSLNTLAQEGVAIPKLSPTPSSPYRVTKLKKPVTPTPVKKVKKATPTIVPVAKTTSNNGGSALGAILFIFFLLILGAVGVILYFKNDTVRSKVNALIHLSPTGEPSSTGQTEEQNTQPESAGNTSPNPPTEQPTEKANTNATPSAHTVGEVIEKDCYIKKKGPDETGTGVWLTLTDDNGATEAHYAKTDAADGFAKVKGVMKTEKGKTYLEISELSADG